MRTTFFIFLILIIAPAWGQEASGTPVPDGVTRLVVYPSTRPYWIEGQNQFQGFESEIVRTDGASTHLGTFRSGFGDIGSSLEINIINQMGQYSRLDLPQATEQRLLHFLEAGPPALITCDCHCFAARVAGLNYPHSYQGGQFQPMASLMAQHGGNFTQVFSEGSMNPGDAILLTAPVSETEESTVHSMIYLGEGLYLSKLGHGGTLVVTNLQEIQTAYPATRMYVYPSSANENEDSSLEPTPNPNPIEERVSL